MVARYASRFSVVLNSFFRTTVVKQTAILHIIGTGVIGAGVFVSGTELTVELLVLGAIFIIAGIFFARRDNSTPQT